MDRVVRLQFSLMVALGLLVGRLAYLQLLQGAHYRELAEHNRLRLVPEPAPRGIIVDRRGRILASNQVVFRVTLIPQELEDLTSVLARVSTLVHRPIDALRREFERERTRAFAPATLVPRVPKEVALRLEEEQWRWPGLLVRAETVRHYPSGSSAAHLLGHLGQPTEDDLVRLKSSGVQARDLIGRVGLERALDEALRGQSGGLLVEVNHRARQVRVVGWRPPKAGARVTLTIDARLQSLIERAFGAQPGACVVLDPRTGEVLAMVSVPAFNPEMFTAGESKAVQRLLEDPETPLMNRATMGAYQPGSIAKLVTAGAALEQKLIRPDTPVSCAGAMTIGDRTFHCWNRDGHGSITLTWALAQSCNVYFMHAGRLLGGARLREAMGQMGFARKTGWPLEERAGHLPQRRLTEGEVALLAIGQGEVLVTVLEAAVMAGALANAGRLIEPWVVRAIGDRPMVRRSSDRRLGWSIETIDAVRAGMREVVRPSYGTGSRAFSPVVSIAGKTGTAQTHLPGRNHGWFVGFCPVEQPRVALAILAEYGGSGGELPAEIAKTICEYANLPDVL